MIRHQITGARLRSRHFWGAEAKLRHLPTLHRLLQAVKSACRAARGCEELIYISSKALFMLLFLVNDRRRPSSLSSRAELPVGIRRNGSGFYEDSELRGLPSPFEPGRRAVPQSQICHFNSIKSEVNFFNSTF